MSQNRNISLGSVKGNQDIESSLSDSKCFELFVNTKNLQAWIKKKL